MLCDVMGDAMVTQGGRRTSENFLYGVLVPYTNYDKNVAAVIIPVMEVASFWESCGFPEVASAVLHVERYGKC